MPLLATKTRKLVTLGATTLVAATTAPTLAAAEAPQHADHPTLNEVGISLAAEVREVRPGTELSSTGVEVRTAQLQDRGTMTYEAVAIVFPARSRSGRLGESAE